MSYAVDRAYGERFIPTVTAIVGPYLLQPSPFEIDTREAADLIVLRAEPVTIGVRIRRPGYERFAHEFTIRSHRDNGAKTELEKIMRGWCGWFFYGHGDDGHGDPVLSRWMLVDMKVWRFALQARGYPRAKERGAIVEKSNGDGTHFIACNVRKWPRYMLIAASHDLLPAEAA